jgi:hypothetical protein
MYLRQRVCAEDANFVLFLMAHEYVGKGRQTLCVASNLTRDFMLTYP